MKKTSDDDLEKDLGQREFENVEDYSWIRVNRIDVTDDLQSSILSVSSPFFFYWSEWILLSLSHFQSFSTPSFLPLENHITSLDD